MSITAILILSGIGVAGVGIIWLKLKKGKKATKQNVVLKRQKKSTIKLQRSRQINEKQKNKINDKINDADSDKLSDAYNDGLQNLPD